MILISRGIFISIYIQSHATSTPIISICAPKPSDWLTTSFSPCPGVPAWVPIPLLLSLAPARVPVPTLSFAPPRCGPCRLTSFSLRRRDRVSVSYLYFDLFIASWLLHCRSLLSSFHRLRKFCHSLRFGCSFFSCSDFWTRLPSLCEEYQMPNTSHRAF